MKGISYFHLRETSNGKLKRVVTGAYTINLRTGQLRYGATIYRQDKDSEHWCRSKHVQRALQRLTYNPVVIEFSPISVEDYGKPCFYQFRRLEHFIRNVCMPLFGAEFRKDRDPYRNTNFQNSIEQIKDRLFTPELSLKEETDQENYEKRCMELEQDQELSGYDCPTCGRDLQTSEFSTGIVSGIVLTCFVFLLMSVLA